MNMRARLMRLEADAAGRGGAGDGQTQAPERELSDEEEADSVGQYLWWSRGPRFLSRSPDTSGRFAEWDRAATETRAEGHTEYRIGLRPLAMTIWLEWKPNILKHRRTHGRWIYTDPPTRLASLPPEQYSQLPPEEMMELLREANQRRGYWSKLGPAP